MLGLTIAAEGSTLLKLAEHVSSTLDQINAIFFAGPLGYLLGSIIGGQFYNRIPGHSFMTDVLLLPGIVIALAPTAACLNALLMIVLILGLAKGAVVLSYNTLLFLVHNEKIDPFMNGLHASFGWRRKSGPA